VQQFYLTLLFLVLSSLKGQHKFLFLNHPGPL
jgi:hypothetical protein